MYIGMTYNYLPSYLVIVNLLSDQKSPVFVVLFIFFLGGGGGGGGGMGSIVTPQKLTYKLYNKFYAGNPIAHAHAEMRVPINCHWFPQ